MLALYCKSKQNRKVRFDMAEVIEYENGLKVLDQMLEDLAGEEFDDFDVEWTGLDTVTDLDQFSATEDEFAEIDSYH